MSSLALLLRALGKRVTGSDLGGGAARERLAAAGVTVYHGHQAEQAAGADLLIRSAAVGLDNPEVAWARERGVPVLTHAQALGALMRDRIGLAVAGTHGKTTTTALLAWILHVAGLDPTLALGGEAINFNASARLGRSLYLVVEADEFDRRFLELCPRLAIITSIEADHLDCFRDLDEIVQAFRAFVERVHPDGLLVTCADAALLDSLDLPRRRERYGFAAHADWRVTAYQPRRGGGSVFRLREPGGAEVRFELPLNGRHNAANAAAAVAAARWAGASLEAASEALRSFQGTRRRFEYKGTRAGVLVVDDYAHHPTELRATLAAARAVHPGRVIAVFQPHTMNRTLKLLPEFAAAFSAADRVVLLPIYTPAGRERELLPVSSADLAARIQGVPVDLVDSLDEAVERLRAILQSGDLALTLGAGDVYLVGERLLEQWAREGRR